MRRWDVTASTRLRSRDAQRSQPIIRVLVLPYICPRVELLRDRSPAHRPHQPEHRPVKPRPIVLAHNRPGDARIAVRIAPIQFIFVVQHHRPFEGARRVGRPLQNFLRPVHPHIVVHPAGVDHLPLRRIPQLVVGLAAFQLLETVAGWARVAGMLHQSFVRPRLGALPVVVVGIVPHKEDRQLPPADQLLKKPIARRAWRLALPRQLLRPPAQS